MIYEIQEDGSVLTRNQRWSEKLAKGWAGCQLMRWWRWLRMWGYLLSALSRHQPVHYCVRFTSEGAWDRIVCESPGLYWRCHFINVPIVVEGKACKFVGCSFIGSQLLQQWPERWKEPAQDDKR